MRSGFPKRITLRLGRQNSEIMVNISCLKLKYSGHSRIKCFVSSTEPQMHKELSTMFLEKRCSLRLLHLVLSREWYIDRVVYQHCNKQEENDD